MAAMATRQQYDQWHGRLDVDHEGDSPWHRLVRQYLDEPRDVAGRRVLEIGAGRGGFSCWVAARPRPPRAIVATDFSVTAVTMGRAFATSRGLSSARWMIGDIQAMPYETESFDTVVSCETVEHVADMGAAVGELARVLRRGGRLFLTMPNYLGPLGLYRGYLRLRGRRFTECGQPINNFTLLPAVRAMVRRAGLRVTAVDGVGHYVPFPGRPPIRLRFLDDPRVLMRWFAHHSLVVAEKV